MSTRKKVWLPLDLADLANSQWISCDQSLTATGLVFFEVHEGIVTIMDAKKLSTKPTEAKGWEDTFKRAAQMQELMRETIAIWLDQWGDSTMLTAVHEAPPAGGGVLVRTESSILTAYAFREVIESFHIPLAAMVTPQAHKLLVSGNRYADKKVHHAELKKLMIDMLDGKLITNEATRDALSVGLYAAVRSSHGR